MPFCVFIFYTIVIIKTRGERKLHHLRGLFTQKLRNLLPANAMLSLTLNCQTEYSVLA